MLLVQVRGKGDRIVAGKMMDRTALQAFCMEMRAAIASASNVLIQRTAVRIIAEFAQGVVGTQL